MSDSNLKVGDSDGPQGGTPRSPEPFAVITGQRGWFEWRLGEVWRYRDLIALFVWRDFVSVYKQTVLGPTWHVIQPLLTTLTLTVVFGLVARLPTDGVPPFLFYLSGVVLWNYFANCLTTTSRTLVSNAHLFGKVYFPRLAVPISVVISNFISFAIQLCILFVILVAYLVAGATRAPTEWALLTPLFVLMVAGYGLGAGIIVSALTTRYRDLAYLVTFGVQLMMYVTPVIFPLSGVPARYQWLLLLNPLTPAFEGFRRGVLGVGTVDGIQLATSFGIMLGVLAVGLMLFTHVEQTSMDTV